MHTQLFSPSLSLPQPTVKHFKSESHHPAAEKDAGHHKHDKFKNRLAEDSYQPSKRSEYRAEAGVRSEMAMQGVATSVSHSAEIQVTTKEGDVITISLNQSETRARSEIQAKQGGDSISAVSENNTTTSGFSMTIEGDLNADEEKSLTDLINKMAKVSDKFFNGNVKSAFKHAQKIGFDTGQIAGFSMDLNKSKSVQAIAAYQQTTVPEQSVNTDLLKQAGDFLAQSKVFLADSASMLNSFSEPKQAFTDLFVGVGQMTESDLQQNDVNSDQPLFLKMIENMGNNIFDHSDDK